VDDSLTKLYPEKSAEKQLADIHFRLGLRIALSTIPAGQWTHGIPQTMKLSAQQAESVFGHDARKSDYDFLKALYEFNPATMQHWAPSPQVQSREQAWLILKSLALLKSAESGIFVLTTPTLRGFQEGDPSVRRTESPCTFSVRMAVSNSSFSRKNSKAPRASPRRKPYRADDPLGSAQRVLPRTKIKGGLCRGRWKFSISENY